MDDQKNQWVEYLKSGKEVPKAVKPKEIIDIHQKLVAKYPGVPLPNPNRIIRTVSHKQQSAIKGER